MSLGEVKEEKVELNYILDEVKNLKVAKANAKRSLDPKRNDIDDSNIMFELNSAVYLISKDELLKMTPGKPEVKSRVKLVIESKTHQVDKKENNPVSVLKLKVTDLDTQYESKVTLNMYHSSQGVHIQGGRRQGKITSCSLVAKFLEEFFKETLANKNALIRRVKQTLLNMDLRKNYSKKHSTKIMKKDEKEKKLSFSCTKCHYKTVVQTELKRHTFKQHYLEELKELKLSAEGTSGRPLLVDGQAGLTQSRDIGSNDQCKAQIKETQIVEVQEDPSAVELGAVLAKEQDSPEVAQVAKV